MRGYTCVASTHYEIPQIRGDSDIVQPTLSTLITCSCQLSPLVTNGTGCHVSARLKGLCALVIHGRREFDFRDFPSSHVVQHIIILPERMKYTSPLFLSYKPKILTQHCLHRRVQKWVSTGSPSKRASKCKWPDPQNPLATGLSRLTYT